MRTTRRPTQHRPTVELRAGEAERAGEVAPLEWAGVVVWVGVGGVGGAVSCRESKTEALEAWCQDSSKACDLSVAERWQAICNKRNCGFECGEASKNSCGGYSLSLLRGVDVYWENYHYDADGELIGVAVRPYPYPCQSVRDLYGTQCESVAGEVQLTCDSADGGS